MRDDWTIGLVVPFATDKIPDEGRRMYPDVRFLARGVAYDRSRRPATTARGREFFRPPNISPSRTSLRSW